MTRDFIIAAALWYAATFIDPFGQSKGVRNLLGFAGAEVLRWGLWCVYWWFQGLNFTGIWVIGHEVSPSLLLWLVYTGVGRIADPG